MARTSDVVNRLLNRLRISSQPLSNPKETSRHPARAIFPTSRSVTLDGYRMHRQPIFRFSEMNPSHRASAKAGGRLKVLSTSHVDGLGVGGDQQDFHRIIRLLIPAARSSPPSLRKARTGCHPCSWTGHPGEASGIYGSDKRKWLPSHPGVCTLPVPPESCRTVPDNSQGSPGPHISALKLCTAAVSILKIG